MHRPTNLPSVPLPSAARDRVTEEVSTNRKPLVQIGSKKKDDQIYGSFWIAKICPTNILIV